MGCECQNINNDKAILAEIERRKANKNTGKETTDISGENKLVAEEMSDKKTIQTE